MRYLICFLTLHCFLAINIHAINTRVYSDTAVISIMKVSSDSFPSLSLLFSAKNKWGYPVWGLNKSHIFISEGNSKCEIISVRQINEKLPINLVIVIDHSESMISDNFSNLSYQQILSAIENEGSNSPLSNAKNAISTFLRNFNKPNDKVMLVGFSSSVDLITSFSNNKTYLSNQLKSLVPNGKTAFYDALKMGIDSLKNLNGINVIVGITDGNDNSSSAEITDIMKMSKENEIPIYIIGLGDIKKNILESICDATHGGFFYTKSSSSLISVYDDVAKHIKSIYEVRYLSKNLDEKIDNRDITLSFNIDTILMKSVSSKYDLPLSYIAKKRQEEESIANMLLYLGISIGLVVIGGVAYFVFKKKKRLIA